MIPGNFKLVFALLAALTALAPEAAAQRNGGGGQGKGKGGGKRRAKLGAKTKASTPTGTLKSTAPAPAAGGFGKLSAEETASEKRFRDLVAQIDAALEKAGASDEEREPVTSLALPGQLAAGSPEWKTLQRPIFLECDRDGSGWISFREASLALGMDRGEYALYDRDRDGRIGSREFITRYDEVLEQNGVFPLPKPVDDSGALVPRTPKQLAAAFDTDGDSALGLAEIGQMLSDYERGEVPPKMALERLDSDNSGKLEGEELAYLSRLVSAAFVLPDKPATKRASRAAEDAFFTLTDRVGAKDETSLPPRITGPVPHFRRLDLDGDGFVTAAELSELQAPLSLPVRPSAVLAALDADEDNRISRKEFADALKPVR